MQVASKDSQMGASFPAQLLKHNANTNALRYQEKLCFALKIEKVRHSVKKFKCEEKRASSKK